MGKASAKTKQELFDENKDLRARLADLVERSQAEEALRRAKEEWERTFDTLPDLIAILDREHRIVRANRAMTQRLGAPLEECRGQICYHCVHGTDRPPGCCPHVLTLADGQEHTAEVHEPRLGGDFLVTTTPLRDERGRHIGSVHIARDITKRKLAEDRRRLLSEVTLQLLASDEPQRVVESLCHKITDHLGCHVFFNYLVDEATGRLHLNACAGIPDETTRQIEWLDCGAAVCACVARDGRPIVVEQVQTAPDPRCDLVRSFGIQAYACHPLLNQGQVIGTLSFGSRTTSSFGQDELEMMRTVADQVALAMQRLRLLETSQQHARTAEAANAAKDQFLANVSHELRTPMAAILGMTELALKADLAPTVREYLRTAKESADGLMQLLNEILDFSRMEAGKFPLQTTPFCLRTILDQTLKTLDLRACEKGLKLVAELPRELPNRLVGDPLRLQQILTNLIGNAIKFTAQGEVMVRVTALPLPDEDRCGAATEEVLLQFDVTDTGMGIPPADQQRIFAPFPGGCLHAPAVWRFGSGAAHCRQPRAPDAGADVGRKRSGAWQHVPLHSPFSGRRSELGERVPGRTDGCRGSAARRQRRPTVPPPGAAGGGHDPEPKTRPGHLGRARPYGPSRVQRPRRDRVGSAAGFRLGADGRPDADRGRIPDHRRHPSAA